MNLLQKRFKVVADYPDNLLEVGEIINIEDDNILEPLEWWQKYPHLFREMSWWEERNDEDLPEYVKFKSGHIVPVVAIQYEVGYVWMVEQRENWYLAHAIPSSKSEFLEQEKSKG